MNLLPQTEKYNVKRGLRLRVLVVAILLISFSFWAGLVMLLPAYFLTPGHLFKSAPEKFSGVSSTTEEASVEILNLPAEIDTKLGFFQNVLNQKHVLDIFSKILEMKPSGVSITSVSFKREGTYNGEKGILVLFTGTAADRDSLVSFSSRLKNSNDFSAVDIPVSSLTKNKNLPFTMNIFIKK